MNILLVSNAGFLRDNGSIYITRMTGEFVKEVENNLEEPIGFFQFVENGHISSGINDHEIDKAKISTIEFYDGKNKIFSYIAAFFKILFFKHRSEITYIFLPGNLSFLMAWKCFLFGKPFALYVRGEYNERLSKPLFRKAKFVNTVGLVFKKDIQRFNKKCHLIKPMVLFDFTKPLQENATTRIKEILFVGRIEEHKGVYEILEAAEILKEKLPDWNIRLIGSGKDIDAIKESIDQKNLSNVILNGPIYNPDQLKSFYLQSSMFLLPTYNEGFPRVLYEAMYFKLPIITTFVGNIPGLMEDGVNCLRIERKSAGSIVNQVSKLAGNQTLQESLRKNASQTMSQLFQLDLKTHSELFTSQYLEL